MDATRCIDDSESGFPNSSLTDSRKWLFHYPGQLKPEEKSLKLSTTKESYGKPEIDRHPKQGRRKKLLEDFYRKLIAEELKARLEADHLTIEDYETDYSRHFKDPDDVPLPGKCHDATGKHKKTSNELAKKTKSEELKTKYPLYGSKPLSYYGQVKGRDTFKIKTTISKPVHENYDNVEY